ncbi:MAG: hypothetical protein KME29_08780 [Calothrix sp. FI2-JRJ7]|jgi:hypothetical protein|nr:hypothetical protein [Calothrix sp. FI2-JRJ7]
MKKPKGWYKQIVMRPLTHVQGYASYEKICENIANIYFSVGENFDIERALLAHPKESMYISAYAMYKVGEAKCPTYYVSKDLLTGLMQSDLSVETDTLNWAMKTGIFMLPEGAILSPENRSMQAIYWHCDSSKGLLYWAGTDGLSSFCRRYKLIENQNRFSYTDAQNMDSEKVVEFNSYLQSIFLRLLLIMECRPEYVETSSARVTINKGFSKSSEKDYYEPLWIGKEYRLKRENTNTENTGASSGSSKSVHWRRGYLRNQAYGEGRQKRKLIWIEPVLVMGGASDL